jgi:hypothetical protein
MTITCGQLLLADHERMEGMLKDLYHHASELEANTPPTSKRFMAEPDPKYEQMKAIVQGKWMAIEESLMNHFAAEENFLFPVLKQVDLQEAMALLGEHQAIRTMLHEIGHGLAIVTSPLTPRFAQLLSEHSKRESALLYAWASAQAPPNIAEALMMRIKRTFKEAP